MEIKFENKNVSMYREISRQTKKVQESAESVVPDTDDDIGRIATVQSYVMLKSKDITSRGVLISGEAVASLLYITESQESMSFVRLSKSFSVEYEVPDIESDAAAQIKLSILSTEARVINPRKVSVTFEISGELSCYKQESISIESRLPENACRGLHARYESAELMFTDAVCEKTFAVNEQFSFPGGKPKPSRLVSGRAEFVVSDSQLIGTKVIVKGSAELAVCYLSDEVNYPVRTEFCTPFSQIIDIGEECMDSCCTSIELTGAYFDIIDTVNGDKALDAELHAVMQLVCRSRKRMTYIADAYSNLMPAECRRQSCRYDAGSEVQKLKLAADERISIVEDCADVLSAFVSVAHISQEQTKISAAVNVDVVYRSSQGQLAAVRRSIGMEGEGSASVRISSARLTDVYLRPDGQYVDGHMALELSCVSVGSVEVRRVDSIELDEENGFNLSQYPAVTLVRAGDETMWELAKEYHSSVEKISAANQTEDAGSAGLLLIPKCV